MTRADQAPSGQRGSFRRLALVIVCLAALIINVDNTILNVALPTLVRDLHATSSQLQWIVDSYAMVFAGLLLVGGTLADRFGRKRVFLIGLTVFAAGSIGAALSSSVSTLIGFRALMGAGAALTIPTSLAIINDMFRDPAERARAIGVWAGTIGLGIAIGPIAGGLLLSRFWWGSIFFVNVPIACIGFLGAVLVVPDSKNPHVQRPDPAGAALSIAGLGLLLWAIIEGPTRGWTSGTVVGAALASLVVLGGFVVWESRSTHPMLKLEFFRERRFSVALAAECLAVFGLMGALFLSTQFLQFDLGYSPLQAGIRILPIAVMVVVGAAASPVIARVAGVKLTMVVGLLSIAAGLWQVSATSRFDTTFGDVVLGLLLIGLGAGLMLPTATNSVIGSVPQGDSGMGSASNTVALQVGGALGVAVIGSVMLTRYQGHLASALVGRHVPSSVATTILGSLGAALAVAARVGGSTGVELARAARTAFMSGNEVALAVGAIVALAAAILVLVALPSESSDKEASIEPDR
ncbi:MAG: DHA2 family efflux MFS transporter permease subunit [Acidimicrobiales bacterium]